MSYVLLAGFLVFGHVFTRSGKVAQVGWAHYFLHSIYALSEPTILRLTDFLVTKKLFTQNPIGRAILWLLCATQPLAPHGVVIPTGVAIRMVRDIEKRTGEKAHIAVGPCVCQKALGRYAEPTYKDISIWYGAEIYKRFYSDEYRLINADEAEHIFKECHRAGLTPIVEFCMQSRAWMFVICNCDSAICCPTRVYNLTGISIYPGPYIASQDDDRCLGKEQCGACITRCNFDANKTLNGSVFLDGEKCMGCGLCVTTCRGKARQLERRADYRGRLLPWEYGKDADVEARPIPG